MKIKKTDPAKMELMMTPMIDVVFQLLIFFMMMPSFGAKEGYLPTNLPDTQGQQPTEIKKQDTFRIDLLHVEPWEVEANKGKVIIRLNQQELGDFAELRRLLRSARESLQSQGQEKVEKQPILISPDMTVWHKHVVAAFDSAVDAGFKNIQFTVPK